MASKTYRAVQVTKPGKLELVERKVEEPSARHVRIRVEACGVCHSDAGTVEGQFPGIAYPRVPGHEVIGKIDALGDGVSGWKVGQRVGVGFLGGPCFVCKPCRHGKFVTCENQGVSGVSSDGGYAEIMIASEDGLSAVPDELSAAEAAPLLCAGLTTFNALRNAPAKAGDLVAVLGVGGLGHLAVQYARHMGFEVVAVDLGAERAELAKRLGAHHYIDSSATDAGEALRSLGSTTLILATASGGKSVAETFKGLRPRGRVIVLGATAEPIQLSSFDLLFGSRGIEGSLTGDPAAGDATLKFSVQTGIQAMIETMPLEQASEAYAKMMAGKARFRIVLTMER